MVCRLLFDEESGLRGRLDLPSGTGRLDLLLPTGCPAKAAYAANPPPEALLDAPFQIQSLCPDKYKKGQVKQPGLFCISGRLDLNQRLQVPQTCTLNPCATARRPFGHLGK